MVAVVAFAMATVGGAEAAEVGEGVAAAEAGAGEQGVSTLGWRGRGP